MTPNITLPILTIAGSDCSGGAGIEADLKTFSAYGLFGMSIILSVVAENTSRVIDSFHLPIPIIHNQFQAIFEDIPPKATKIGMVGSIELIDCVAQNLDKYNMPNLVLDPVMFAKNGFALMPVECCQALKKLIAYANVLTPNIPEAQYLCGFSLDCLDKRKDACKALYDLGAKYVLLKGGHLDKEANDLLFDGRDFYEFEAKKIQTKHTHGTGCTLSSAIAANLALGCDVIEAIRDAKQYVYGAILHAPKLGQGNGPIHHFFRGAL